MANSPSLLTLLNANAHLTPDQIAAKLKPKTWYKFGDLTDQQFEELANKHMVHFKLNSRGQVETSETRGKWRFWGHRSDYDRSYFRSTLANYHGILAEEYQDGDRPPNLA